MAIYVCYREKKSTERNSIHVYKFYFICLGVSKENMRWGEAIQVELYY